MSFLITGVLVAGAAAATYYFYYGQPATPPIAPSPVTSPSTSHVGPTTEATPAQPRGVAVDTKKEAPAPKPQEVKKEEPKKTTQIPKPQEVKKEEPKKEEPKKAVQIPKPQEVKKEVEVKIQAPKPQEVKKEISAPKPQEVKEVPAPKPQEVEIKKVEIKKEEIKEVPAPKPQEVKKDETDKVSLAPKPQEIKKEEVEIPEVKKEEIPAPQEESNAPTFEVSGALTMNIDGIRRGSQLSHIVSSRPRAATKRKPTKRSPSNDISIAEPTFADKPSVLSLSDNGTSTSEEEAPPPTRPRAFTAKGSMILPAGFDPKVALSGLRRGGSTIVKKN